MSSVIVNSVKLLVAPKVQKTSYSSALSHTIGESTDIFDIYVTY